MKVKRMGITEILRRVWLFSANKIKSSESFSKQPTQLNNRRTQLIIAAHNCPNYGSALSGHGHSFNYTQNYALLLESLLRYLVLTQHVRFQGHDNSNNPSWPSRVASCPPWLLQVMIFIVSWIGTFDLQLWKEMQSNFGIFSCHSVRFWEFLSKIFFSFKKQLI